MEKMKAEAVLEELERLMDLVEVAEACLAFTNAAQKEAQEEPQHRVFEDIDPLVGNLFDVAAFYVAKYDVQCMGNEKGSPKGKRATDPEPRTEGDEDEREG